MPDLHLSDHDLTAIANVVRSVLNEQKTTTRQSEPDLLTRDEAATLLHISKHRLWQMQRQGQITARQVGRRLLYSRKALLAALETGLLARGVE